MEQGAVIRQHFGFLINIIWDRIKSC